MTGRWARPIAVRRSANSGRIARPSSTSKARA